MGGFKNGISPPPKIDLAFQKDPTRPPNGDTRPGNHHGSMAAQRMGRFQGMDKSERFWDRAAATYDREERKDEPTSVRIIERTGKYLKTDDIVLDYGCGTGTIDIEMAGHVKQVCAIDISSRMIEIAKRKTAARGIENIDYLQATIWHHDLKDESFDAVTAFLILHLVEDTRRAMSRIHDLLKPGGVFISVTPCMGERRLWNAAFWLVSRTGLVPRINAFERSELEDAISKPGFKILETGRMHARLPIYFIAAQKSASDTRR